MNCEKDIADHFFEILEENDYWALRVLVVYFWKEQIGDSFPICSITRVSETNEWNRRYYFFFMRDGKILYVETGFEVNKVTKQIETVAICYKLYHQLFELSLYPVKYIAFSFVYQDQYDLELVNNYGMYHQQAALEIKKMEKDNCDSLVLEQYKKDKNLLGKNEFYIINMLLLQHIPEDCQVSEKFLVWLVHLYDKIEKFNEYLYSTDYFDV